MGVQLDPRSELTSPGRMGGTLYDLDQQGPPPDRMPEHTLLGLGPDGRPDEAPQGGPPHEGPMGERGGLPGDVPYTIQPQGPHGLLPPHFPHHLHSHRPDLGHPDTGVSSVCAGEVEPSLCAGCGAKILDRYYLLAVDKQWHVNCLKCADCQLPLDSELTCFAKDGHIYCKEDYYRRFAVKRCARCHMGISANELVMRAREHVFHMGCFTCASCHKTLATGDYFGMKDALIYCRQHYELLLTGDCLLPDGLNTGALQHQLAFYNGVGAAHKGRPRKRKSPAPDGGEPLMQHLGLGQENDLHMETYHTHSQPPRQKRVRTSFKHHQLRTMKSYFALNHNPDAKDLKQLAQKTGLSKRVLQVWFQNARAKYRRNMLKQQSGSDGQQHEGAGGSLDSQDGTPKTDANSNTLTELSNSGSPALSDISSSPSLSELQGPLGDGDQNSSGSSLTELFTNSINTMQ